MKYAKLGTVSHGTCNPEHLIPRLADELECHVNRNAGELCTAALTGVRQFLQDCREYCDADDETRAELDECELLAQLCTELETYAPAFAYFGTTEGDGSDYGFWVNVDDVKEDVEWCCRDDDEPPADYRGMWLHVSDRGSCTLYDRTAADTDREVWGIV